MPIVNAYRTLLKPINTKIDAARAASPIQETQMAEAIRMTLALYSAGDITSGYAIAVIDEIVSAFTGQPETI